jgi:hypothetical protein
MSVVRTERKCPLLAVALSGSVASIACGSASARKPMPQIDCWSGVGEQPGGVVEIGTGVTRFEPLLDGQALDLYAGPQGGFHFFLHARLQDLFPGELEDRATLPYTYFTAEFGDGTSIGVLECASRLPYPVESQGYRALDAGRFLPLHDDFVDRLAVEPVLVSVAVLDCDGLYAEDHRWVMPQLKQDGIASR